jgi:hypothetical protein
MIGREVRGREWLMQLSRNPLLGEPTEFERALC